MKLLILLVVFAAFATISIDAKNAICDLPHSKNGEMIACTAYIPSYSYDSNRNECVRFVYGGCKGNDNRFLTREDCEAQCLD
ncbi:male accessory gland serine protease inhibitor-like [Drosophila bipectinata]|uniref:male accessory gland serine protease inhibitor-like n=1 Tax=Drosophila bipectinata TaxID=42026 RepID=UPI001C8AF97F|nr:male accessory gland serine protease inhibitor-like [Drosophila bipectinata]